MTQLAGFVDATIPSHQIEIRWNTVLSSDIMIVELALIEGQNDNGSYLQFINCEWGKIPTRQSTVVCVNMNRRIRSTITLFSFMLP
jgi:hypothetical protein